MSNNNNTSSSSLDQQTEQQIIKKRGRGFLKAFQATIPRGESIKLNPTPRKIQRKKSPSPNPKTANFKISINIHNTKETSTTTNITKNEYENLVISSSNNSRTISHESPKKRPLDSTQTGLPNTKKRKLNPNIIQPFYPILPKFVPTPIPIVNPYPNTDYKLSPEILQLAQKLLEQMNKKEEKEEEKKDKKYAVLAEDVPLVKDDDAGNKKIIEKILANASKNRKIKVETVLMHTAANGNPVGTIEYMFSNYEDAKHMVKCNEGKDIRGQLFKIKILEDEVEDKKKEEKRKEKEREKKEKAKKEKEEKEEIERKKEKVKESIRKNKKKEKEKKKKDFEYIEPESDSEEVVFQVRIQE